MLEQKQIQALKVKEMESSSKIKLKDLSWWRSIKEAYRIKVLITAKLSKKKVYLSSCKRKVILGCTKASLKEGWVPPQPKKHTLPK